MSMSKQHSLILRLVESALMIAFGVVLSVFPLVKLPYGGSVTLAQMLPIAILAYRYGVKWGLGAALAFGIIQSLFDLSLFSYATSAFAVVAILLLDFLFAFAVFGLSGIFRKQIPSQRTALTLGISLACVLRFVCHFLSGIVIWSSLTPDGMIYSLAYNGMYMLPELLIAATSAYFLGGILDFRKERIAHFASAHPNAAARPVFTKAFVLSAISKLIAAAFLSFVIVSVFNRGIQNPDDGTFVVSGIINAPWTTIAAVSFSGGVLSVLFELLSRRFKKKAV